jgi:hypothetical protein
MSVKFYVAIVCSLFISGCVTHFNVLNFLEQQEVNIKNEIVFLLQIALPLTLPGTRIAQPKICFNVYANIESLCG